MNSFQPRIAFTLLLLVTSLTITKARIFGAVIPVSDSAALQQAINSAPDGSVIELAGGTYASPSGGFTIYNPTAGFTVRAATGAVVNLNGAGATDILRFTNSSKPITFQGISFLNGVSNDNYIGGAITLDTVEAVFVACTFQNNAANGSITGGGGVWINDSKVLFQSCVFTGNSSMNYGAAFSALASQVFINGSRFSNNRSNPANHHANSAGGAINANGTLLRIANCKFDRNQAGLAGGAIYAYGPWKDPLSTPVTQLIVANSTFSGNLAARGDGGPVQSPPIGGAVFSEDQTTSQFFNCRFDNNSARLGGALASYRAIVEVVGCVFNDNQAGGTAADESIGGAIISLSADNKDGSTDNGKINRRSSQLTIRDTLIQGVLGTNNAGRGGGIFASGDLAAAYGLGFPQNGTIESNRASVSLTRVAFVNLTAAGDNAIGSGLGGALQGDFASVTADHVIVENCNATNYGGAFRFGQNSVFTLTNSTIVQTSAAYAGAGITMFSGALNLKNCNFISNALSLGTHGTAITTGPQAATNIPALDVTGVVDSCVFTNNGAGSVIYDGDGYRSGPSNRVQYRSNQIFSPPNDAYYSDVPGVGPQTVVQLNALSIRRADGSVDQKAPGPNFAPASAPSVGTILMVPPNSLASGAPDESTPIPANVIYASNGAGGVAVDGAARRTVYGVIPNVADGPHTLTVGGVSFKTIPPPAAALNMATRLPVGAGQNVLIGGFITVGQTPKRVLIRAIGPSIPVAGALADPNLEVHDSRGATIGRNDNWRSTLLGGAIPMNQAVEIESTSIAPTKDLESAMVLTLDPGAYTAVVSGTNGKTGIALVEIYDLDAVQDSTLANISTRGFIQTADNIMIGGFIYLGGPGATKVVLRGIGPSLRPLGIANALQDPFLELKDANGTTVESNDNWGQSGQAAAIRGAGLLPTDPAESAIYKSGLPLGPYTATLKGVNGTGVGVLEIYIFQ